MLDKTAGIPTQIRQLEKRLKEMDASKVSPAKIKEITDTLNNLKSLLKEKQEKKEQRRKEKEQKAAEVEKEAVAAPSAANIGAVTQNAPAPAATPGAPASTPDDQKVSCPLCGGLTFNDNAAYQQHMAYTHASDIMPTGPGQKQDKLVASTEVEAKNKCVLCDIDFNSFPEYDAHRKEKHMSKPEVKEAAPEYKPMDPEQKKEVVKHVEKNLGDAIIEAPKTFKVDDKVKSTRSNSVGRVMRWDGGPADLVYVYWDEGPLKQRDAFGGYYPDDVELIKEQPVEAAFPMEKPICKECESRKHVEGDLRSNYDALLADLKEERKLHYEQGNHKWVARLDQKIQELENSIAEKFNKKESAMGGPRFIRQINKANSVKEGGAQNDSDGLVIMDHSPAQAQGITEGKDELDSEFESEWAEPVRSATKLNVFKRELLATPSKEGYDISADGKKLFNIKGKDNTPLNQKQLEFCAQIELTRGMKQAKLVEKIANLEAGSQIFIVAEDKAARRVKFASIEHGIRGWIPTSKVAFLVKEGQMMKHKDHIDNTFGHNGKETLVDCPNGSGNMVWLPMAELLPINQPPATPESLNDTESAKIVGPGNGKCPNWDYHHIGQKCETCGLDERDIKRNPKEKKAFNEYTKCSKCKHAKGEHSNEDVCKQCEKACKYEPIMDVEAAKECADCHGHFEGAEGETCPTCGRFAVEKSALKQALPPAIMNQRTDVQAGRICPMCKNDVEEKTSPTGVCEECSKAKTASLNKVARVVHRDDGWHVLSEKGKNLGGPYKTKEEAVKRLRQVEYFKHHGSIKPFSKKVIAEALNDPYQSLTTHIENMRSRMNQVQERIQSAPVVKAAGEKEEDNSKMDLPKLFEDLAQGIDLLENKLGGDENSDPTVHKMVEELENKLWKLEEECGITPKLSEEEKAEPEHKEIVEDIEEKEDVKKKADTVTDETETETITNDPNAVTPTTTTPAAPVIQNVQPTDQDNLDVPVAAPTSPAPQGQKWVYNPEVMAYVLMPDPSMPGKTI